MADASMDWLAGALTVRPGVARPGNLLNTRPDWVARLTQGKPASTLPDLLSSLFNLCGHAHRLCASLALELSYLRAFASADVVERSIKEMRRSASISDEQAEKWKAAMRQVLPDVSAGDRVTGVYRPGVGASFLMNGKALGEIRDAEFARLFFGIWLSPKTSEPALRKALMAGAGG